MSGKNKIDTDSKSEGNPSNHNNEKSASRDFFESLIVAIILALVIKTFSLQTFQIPTGSMEDNLLVGDHIIVNKLIFGPETSLLKTIVPIRDVRRGDIVIFKYPPEPRIDYIKRVIGMPGETIRIYQHQVYINGIPVEETGLDEDRYTLQWRHADTDRAQSIGVNDTYDPLLDPEAAVERVFQIPEGEYFMMGDHRNVSRDSRYWGTVPRKNITGRAIMTYWSYNADRSDFQQTGFVGQIANILKTIVNLPFKTRWDRFFRIIS